MTEFQDLYITDLDEKQTRRNAFDNEIWSYHFELSGEAPYEWRKIFESESRDIKNHRLQRRQRQSSPKLGRGVWGSKNTREQGKDIIKEIKERSAREHELRKESARTGIITSNRSIIVMARERDVEEMKQLADKIIQRTNKKYREHLHQQEKDANQVSNLRNRLFGKSKR